MSLNKCQNCLLGKSAEFDLCKMCESVLLKNKCDKCHNTLRKIQYYDYINYKFLKNYNLINIIIFIFKVRIYINI